MILTNAVGAARPAARVEEATRGMKPPVLRDRVVKRLLDIVVAAAALVLLSLLIGAIALAVKVESRGPVFYRARRVGLGGREFPILKFRKMRSGAVGPMLTAGGDERVTRLGRFLSMTKLDEIPQLWNVLSGSMSLVGPRPQDPAFVALRRDDYEEILQVKPGMTGLYQLAFARETEVLDAQDHVGDYVRRLLPQKTWLDRLYVVQRSILMDLRILGWTAIILVFRSEVAVDRSTGRITLRRRPPQLVPKPRQAAAIGDLVHTDDRAPLEVGTTLVRTSSKGLHP